jgi:hypothetical protein
MGTLGKDRPMAVRTELRRIVSEGMYRYLLSDFEYGTRTFKINARIEFAELRAESAVDARIVLGWNASEKKPRYLLLV